MKTVSTTYDIVTEDSAIEGDIAESGWLNQEGYYCTPEHDEETAVDIAVEFIKNEGFTEFSSSKFHPGGWYISCGEQDMYSGECENHNYHLNGFSPEEEEEIYKRLVKRG